MHRYRILCFAFACATAIQPVTTRAQQPAAGPQQCISFNTLADQHEGKAQSILKSIETDTQNRPADEVARVIQDRSTAAASEQQFASLARDAYKKCLTDYLAGGSAAPAAAAAPVQQAPVQQVQPMQQAPVQQAPVQQAPVQQAQPVQQHQPQQRVYRQQQHQQQQQQQQQPGILFNPGGLIDLGLGIGLGRTLRDRNQ